MYVVDLDVELCQTCMWSMLNYVDVELNLLSMLNHEHRLIIL
jgi:hypothetical protein